jgi:flagellar biosynthetic protein FliP
MKNRLKNYYCRLTFGFACIVVVMTIILCICQKSYVYATASGTDESGVTDSVTTGTDMDPDSIAQLENTESQEIADSSTDSTDGFSIIYNNESGSLSTPVRMLLVLTILSLAPSILIMLTSYTRIIVVLHFVRTAIGTQSSPPNQVMIGLALFLTFFIMWPTFQEINTVAIQPLDAGEITLTEALTAAQQPLREFMYGQTQRKDLSLFIDISGGNIEDYEDVDDIPFTTIVPAFILSELRTAFIIGFLIYIPFIVIDMVVASVLMSMGMMMLPPTTISMPFKILLFVLADGWDLIIKNLVMTFY